MKKPKYSQKNLPQRHSAHHKLHMKWLGIPVRPSMWRARDRTPEPRHDMSSPMIELAGSHKTSCIMYVCMYVCMYVRTYVCAYIHIHTHRYIYIYIYIYTYQSPWRHCVVIRVTGVRTWQLKFIGFGNDVILAFTLAVQFPFEKICSPVRYEHKPLLKCGNPELQLRARIIFKKQILNLRRDFGTGCPQKVTGDKQWDFWKG